MKFLKFYVIFLNYFKFTNLRYDISDVSKPFELGVPILDSMQLSNPLHQSARWYLEVILNTTLIIHCVQAKEKKTQVGIESESRGPESNAYFV